MSAVEYIKVINNIDEVKLLLYLLYNHSDEFPMCADAYRRKMLVGYAGVCDCCRFGIYYDLSATSYKTGCECLPEYQWLEMAVKLGCVFDKMQKFLDRLSQKFCKVGD